jgi:hypothetical protein
MDLSALSSPSRQNGNNYGVLLLAIAKRPPAPACFSCVVIIHCNEPK